VEAAKNQKPAVPRFFYLAFFLGHQNQRFRFEPKNQKKNKNKKGGIKKISVKSY